MIENDRGFKEVVAKFNLVGVNALVCDKTDIKFLYSDGYLDLDGRKLDYDTIFRIASISKIEAAICIMILKEQGKLDVYDDVSKYLGFKLRNPKYPDDIVTLEHIMTQTSSISDKDDGEAGYDAVNCHSKEVNLERMFNDKDYIYHTDLMFTDYRPGEHWQYSNFGCGILACVVEKVSGEYFTDFARKHIFLPLGLDASFRASDIIHQERIATLYEYDTKSNQFIKQRDQKMFNDYVFPRYPLGNNFRGPAGGLFISIKDLSIIQRMMMNKGIYNNVRILKEETVEEMERVHWSGISYDPNYRAKGLQLNLVDGFSKERLIGHTGSAYGLRSTFFYNTHYGYIVISNGGDYEHFGNHMTHFQEDTLNYLIRKFEDNGDK